MKRFFKLILINIVIISSILINFKMNISYCQSYDKIDKLISNQEKEEYLNKRISDLENIIKNKDIENNYLVRSNALVRKINIDAIKTDQAKIIKIFFEKELKKCEKLEQTLIDDIKIEKANALENSKATYIKGQWPLEEYTYISSKFSYRIHPISNTLKFHSGVDIPAPKNTDVLASDDGIVIYANNANGYGNLVKIEHFDGKITVYAHNNSILVKEGDIVKKGQVISKVGSTGNSTGNHLHFEVIANNELQNPLDCVD